MLLRELGLDPAGPEARNAIGLVRDKSDWGPYHSDSPFFEGEVEPCINGRVLACGAYFGEASERLVDRLLGEQLEDGGWNCDAPPSKRSSFNSTICVLEGLSNTRRQRAARLREGCSPSRRGIFVGTPLVQVSFHRKVIDRDRKNHRLRWRGFSFPTRWCYDVLRGLDYLRKAGVAPMNGRWKPSTWWQGIGTRTDDGRSITYMRVKSTSSWKVGKERRAAGTPSVRCVC